LYDRLRLKSPLKLVYSVSDVRNLVEETIRSVKTARKYFNKNDIIIFYTPPRSESNYIKLTKLGTVLKEKNLTENFKINKGHGRFGEKFQALFLDVPNIIVLDSDTIIRKDLSELINDNYEFSGRIAPGFLDMDIEIWNSMFVEREKIPIPMLNTGFMIFRDYFHNKIADEVLGYMDSNLPSPHPKSYFKDQYAISLAVSGSKIKWMNRAVHSFLWNSEFGGYVLHGSKLEITSDLGNIKNKMTLWLDNNVSSLFN